MTMTKRLACDVQTCGICGTVCFSAQGLKAHMDAFHKFEIRKRGEVL